MKTIITSFLLCVLSFSITAQNNIRREGNTFIVDTTTTKSQDIKTEYTYKDKKGNIYPIYMSKNGKCFIVKVSKNSGKEYKQYLPEITATLTNTTTNSITNK